MPKCKRLLQLETQDPVRSLAINKCRRRIESVTEGCFDGAGPDGRAQRLDKRHS